VSAIRTVECASSRHVFLVRRPHLELSLDLSPCFEWDQRGRECPDKRDRQWRPDLEHRDQLLLDARFRRAPGNSRCPISGRV
jgi:hypothetical protein